MAERIELFNVTVPAGTLSTSPQTTALSFNDGDVEFVEFLIPPGPSGLVGFRLRHSGETVIPYDRAGWIVADNEVIKWPLEGYPSGEAWSLMAYNTDVYPHTIYIRIGVRESRRSLIVRASLVPIAPGGSAEDQDATQ